MPFYIYRCKPESKTTLRFERKCGTQLAGNEGLITKTAKEHGYLDKNNAGWQLTAKQMLERFGENCDRIISDVTPKRTDNQILASIEYVSGYSFCSWAPLLLHMFAVADNVKLPNKKCFSCNNDDFQFIRSFVYIGKQKKGGWIWGQTGRVNGPLLNPDAMKFFQKEIESIGYKAKVSI